MWFHFAYSFKLQTLSIEEREKKQKKCEWVNKWMKERERKVSVLLFKNSYNLFEVL